MKDKITKEKLEKYFDVTKRALEKAETTIENLDIENARKDFLDMIQRYIKDAEKGEIVNSFAALNYAHGWLDAGARIGLWDVHDSELFAKD